MSISQPLHTSHSHSAQPVIGVLLVNGFNGSRYDMAALQRILNAHDIRLVKYVIPLVPTIREDVHDPEARRRYIRDVYSWMPMRPIESTLQFLPQLRTELPQITVPALIMASIHDHVVPARDGREIYRLIGSREKHLVTLHHSYHVITRDRDREEVFDKTLAFVQRHARTANSHNKESTTDQAV